MNIVVKVLDPVDCEISKIAAKILEPLFEYPAVYYRQGQYRKTRIEYKKTALGKSADGNVYWFYTGFLDRVRQFCEDKKIDLITMGTVPKLPYNELQGICIANAHLKERANSEMREDQLRILHSALAKQRGMIQSPTGSGKTILAASIIEALLGKTLYLLHNLSLIRQTFTEFKNIGLRNVTMFTGEEKDLNGNTVVATVQSMSKLAPDLYCTRFDIVVVDESHHIGKLDGTYATVLRNCLATARFGFTATLPTTPEAVLATEGLLGPLVDQLSLAEGIEKGILATPKVKIVKLPLDHKVKELRKYQDVYDQGVVHNDPANRIIINTVREQISAEKTVLILVTRIDHGENLVRLANENKIKVYFAQGSTGSEVREKIRKALHEKQFRVVIATTVFKEGINIPSLDVIMYAAQQKSDIAVLQSFGRGLRATKDKTEVLLVDFFNPSHRFLIEAFGNRISLYSDLNWL